MSAIQSNEPEVTYLETLPIAGHRGRLDYFSLANFHNKLVILTGGSNEDFMV